MMITDKRIIIKWIEELRSDGYEQGQEVLRSGNDKYCCLGILCEILELEKELIIRFDDTASYTYKSKDGRDQSFTILPKGMSFPNIRNLIDDITGKIYGLNSDFDESYYTSLTELNDNGLTFNQIADIIEWYYLSPQFDAIWNYTEDHGDDK